MKNIEYLQFKFTQKLSASLLDLHELCQVQLERARRQLPAETQHDFLQNQSGPTHVIPSASMECMPGKEEVKATSNQNVPLNRGDIEDNSTPKKPIKTKQKTKLQLSHRPKKPISSFLLFYKDQQASISEKYPNQNVTELTKIAANCWKDLSNEEKQPYVRISEQERQKYKQLLRKYKEEYPNEVAEEEKNKSETKNKNDKQKKIKKEKKSPKKERQERSFELMGHQERQLTMKEGEIVVQEIERISNGNVHQGQKDSQIQDSDSLGAHL